MKVEPIKNPIPFTKRPEESNKFEYNSTIIIPDPNGGDNDIVVFNGKVIIDNKKDGRE